MKEGLRMPEALKVDPLPNLSLSQGEENPSSLPVIR